MNTLTYLFCLKAGFFLSLGVDILLLAFHHPIPGGILLLGGLTVMWRFYRCPECKRPLDLRLPLREMEYCPSCGCDFTSHTK